MSKKEFEKNKSWISKWISREDLERVEGVVSDAEKKTSAEIVPIVIGRSSTTGHVPAALFFFMSTLGVIAAFYLNHYEYISDDHPASDFWMLVVSIGVISMLSSIFLARFDFIQRQLTPKTDQAIQVFQRAEVEFYESNIKKTVDSTGVLLLVSLMEHRAIILADKAVNEKFRPSDWESVLNTVIEKLKKNDLAGGLSMGVQKIGEMLAPVLPIKEGDENELPNHVVLKEC